MLSKTCFTHSDILCWQIDYAGGSLNVNGPLYRDAYKPFEEINTCIKLVLYRKTSYTIFNSLN
ncbi:hypothetical protein EC588_23775 [Klebsiella quasipneumoniae subsp. similipneumoniae]|nr:hypothetical protein EC588_23775 [Klebsiella quasipneumoniae subsp. similipneumoniae]